MSGSPEKFEVGEDGMNFNGIEGRNLKSTLEN